MDFICPSCKSDNIQRLSVIYEGGLSAINTKTQGSAIGFGGGGMAGGAGTTRTTGTAQTASSQKSAPPAKKTYLKPLLGIFGLFLLLSLFVGSRHGFVTSALNIGWLVASVSWIYHAFQYNSGKWRSLKAIWDDSYLCNRCNEMFALRGS